MSNRGTFKADLYLSITQGGEAETVAMIEYTFTAGSPETGLWGPPENYDPGSPDLVEIDRVTIDGEVAPLWLRDIFMCDDDLLSTIAAKYREAEEYAREDYMAQRGKDRARGLED